MSIPTFEEWKKSVNDTLLDGDQLKDSRMPIHWKREDVDVKPTLALFDHNDYQYYCPDELDFVAKTVCLAKSIKLDQIKGGGGKMNHEHVCVSLWGTAEKEKDNVKMINGVVEAKVGYNKEELYKKFNQLIDWL